MVIVIGAVGGGSSLLLNRVSCEQGEDIVYTPRNREFSDERKVTGGIAASGNLLLVLALRYLLHCIAKSFDVVQVGHDNQARREIGR